MLTRERVLKARWKIWGIAFPPWVNRPRRSAECGHSATTMPGLPCQGEKDRGRASRRENEGFRRDRTRDQGLGSRTRQGTFSGLKTEWPDVIEEERDSSL